MLIIPGLVRSTDSSIPLEISATELHVDKNRELDKSLTSLGLFYFKTSLRTKIMPSNAII